MDPEVSVPEEVARLFPLGDAGLKAIRWIDNGIAIELDIPNVGPVRLVFDWATDVRIDLDFGDVAEGLLWDADTGAGAERPTKT